MEWNKEMKIVLFSDTYPPQINGVATATYTLAKTLKDRGHEVLVVTTSLANQLRITEVDGILRIPGLTIKRLYNYKFSSIYNTKAFRAIRKYNPDVIHVQTEVGIGIFGRIIAHNLKIPLVYTYHTMYEDYTYYVTKGRKPFDFFVKRIVASLSVMIGDSTTEFITTSSKTKEALRRYGVKKYINIVPNGIDLSAFDISKIDQSKAQNIQSKYGLEGKFVVLILGRLASEKSNDVVIKYLHNFIEENQEYEKLIKLLIVGDGPAKKDLEHICKQLKMENTIEFVGSVPHEEVPYFYHISDLYCSASTSETQGLTYDEAMAAKTIVLAKFDDNLTDVIKDGETGFFFKTQSNFSSKLKTIINISEEQKESLLMKAYQNDLDLFSLDKYYERMMNVYKKALRKYW
jgi:1,2-diacylglycerol 3-alpha-glucosyltransferase